MNLLKTVFTYAALFCVGAATSAACFKPDLQNPSFRCDPSSGDADKCPEGETCCSDDPSTVGGKKPNYYMDNVQNDEYGVPLFSDINNSLSTQGMCVELGGFMSPLVNGCPVPCNPTWDAGTIGEICGPTQQCCQTQELDSTKDCIMVDGRWRAARGEDIIAKRTGWGPAHTTNQDPFAKGCNVFAQGNTDSLRDCIEQLTVANQRGFCYSLGCPCVEDECDKKNPDFAPKCPGQAPPPQG